MLGADSLPTRVVEISPLICTHTDAAQEIAQFSAARTSAQRPKRGVWIEPLGELLELRRDDLVVVADHALAADAQVEARKDAVARIRVSFTDALGDAFRDILPDECVEVSDRDVGAVQDILAASIRFERDALAVR